MIDIDGAEGFSPFLVWARGGHPPLRAQATSLGRQITRRLTQVAPALAACGPADQERAGAGLQRPVLPIRTIPCSESPVGGGAEQRGCGSVVGRTIRVPQPRRWGTVPARGAWGAWGAWVSSQRGLSGRLRRMNRITIAS